MQLSTQRATILLIDDDPSLHDQVHIHFQQSSYDFMHAGDATEGFQQIEDTLPNVVVCDVMLPDDNGLDVFYRLQKKPLTRSIPTILISGEYTQEAGLAGVDAYLVKPFTMDELEQAIAAQLGRARRMEEKFGSTLSILRTNIAYALPHELRTPLSHIRGYAEIIELEAGDEGLEDFRDHAGTILKAVDRLSHLVENYMAYAQLQIIEANPTQRAGLRNTIIKTARHINEVTAERANHYDRMDDLKVDQEPTAIRMTSDNLCKIVYELVDNALKFSEPGTPVYVKTGVKDRNFMLQIQDFGRGMSAEQLENIGAYMQFDRAIHEQQGSGLGLAIVRQLVRMHEGYMQVKSDVEKGTVIRLSLPQE
ncbi:MAG: hybrid sensor histidine kinase/response regulator [Chloroflexota bacterium]